MDLQIEKLLEKYWQGETSLAEEKRIKAYFTDNPDLSMEGSYFKNTSESQKTSDQIAFAHPAKRKRLVWISAAAAILILLFAIPIVINTNQVSNQFAVEDPTEAYEITRASLLMVSNGLNKGKTYSKKELNKFNDAKTIIQKQ